MTRAQSSWILGLLAGLLLGAVIWFGVTQMPFSPVNTNSTSNAMSLPTKAAALDRADCIRAALASPACTSNQTVERTATFTYNNQTYPCHCNTPESDASQNFTTPTPWPEEDEPQPSLEPWPDLDRIQTTVVTGPGVLNDAAENRSDGARRVSQGPGSDQNPAFLDENTLVFTRFSLGYNQGPASLMGIYLNNLTEFLIWQDEAQNVNTNGNPFTPDKKQICYASDVEDADEIWCLNLATRQRMRITRHNASVHHIEPSVSSDGKQIAFEMHPDADWDNPGQIWTTDFSENATALVADDSDSRLPQFNPEDDRLLFQRRTGPAEQNVFHLVIRHLNKTLETLVLPTAGGTDASWASDHEIVYSSEDERLPQAKIFSYDLDTKVGRQQTLDPSVEDGAPAVSPNGQWLAFESHRTPDENSPTRIWIIQRK